MCMLHSYNVMPTQPYTYTTPSLSIIVLLYAGGPIIKPNNGRPGMTTELTIHTIIMVSFFAVDRPNHKLQYPIGVNFCLEESTDEYYYFTLNCSLESAVDPVAEFLFDVTQYSNGVAIPLSSNTADITINIISETSQSVTVNGTFSLSEGVSIACSVSNMNGNDSLMTTLSHCGKCYI